ncbi:EM14S01-3B_G0030490.mRNA.1.CDS.1 [Saccharomyces cerevisiae]|nr:EM14S01-3B_G0048000.mRNA.1.CDS.1 [Saccharomyces cerevisiae]CAD6614745.1 EM14S01-3B_G0047970.mRNA.1.CDS.1 [Saccharomyces cerevisiae]CAD6623037.1 EM14S01-3B_G0050050.mRNA.1.CDS.1 [Saccharomyces cerevisiae]CAD6625767.1 EM14S01-3B_G0035680.mRNA.1.CDS.1 [Saccharomyces cerevisiae]CAD6633542.1 EM14S01-3B_G0005430.mRNA.1.CDS.1 [Saccharomyces cerevisiae]
MADTLSVAVQAPPGYGKTELFHLALIALASKGDVKYVLFPYTVLQSHDSQNFIGEGYGGATDLYVGDTSLRLTSILMLSRRAIFLSGRAPEAVAGAALQRIGLTSTSCNGREISQQRAI